MSGVRGQQSPMYKFVCTQGNFLLVLRVLRDAHDVSLHYSELLLQDSLPVALQYYKNYTKETEMFFNASRKMKRNEIGMSFHDFYNELAYLNYMYEQPINNASMRRNVLLSVFNKSYIIQKLLIEDLYNACVGGIIS
jgi:hypothetical protein